MQYRGTGTAVGVPVLRIFVLEVRSGASMLCAIDTVTVEPG